MGSARRGLARPVKGKLPRMLMGRGRYRIRKSRLVNSCYWRRRSCRVRRPHGKLVGRRVPVCCLFARHFGLRHLLLGRGYGDAVGAFGLVLGGFIPMAVLSARPRARFVLVRHFRR